MFVLKRVEEDIPALDTYILIKLCNQQLKKP